jgi:hypothetical protein
MQKNQAAKTFSMDMQYGHEAWTCNKYMQLGHVAAATCSKFMQQGIAVWTGSMDMKHGHAASTCSLDM